MTCPYCAVADTAEETDAKIQETRTADVGIPVVDVVTADGAWLDGRLLLSRDWSTFERLPAMRDLGVPASYGKPRMTLLADHESDRNPAGIEGRRLLARARECNWIKMNVNTLGGNGVMRKTCLLETFFFEMASNPTHSTFA